MHNAGYEWAAYVARRNEVEVARMRARRPASPRLAAGTPATPRMVSPRLGTVALSAGAGTEARNPEIAGGDAGHPKNGQPEIGKEAV